MKNKPKRVRIAGGPFTREDVKQWIYRNKRKHNKTLGQVLDKLVDHAKKTGMEF